MFLNEEHKSDGYGFLLFTLMILMAGIGFALIFVTDRTNTAQARIYVQPPVAEAGSAG